MTQQYGQSRPPFRAGSSNNVFQMPSYTSHTSRGAGSPGNSSKPQFFGDFSGPKSPKGATARMIGSHKPSHMDSDQSLLEMLSSTVACLKQKNMDLEALGCLEQSLWLKRRMFGVDNSVVRRALHEVVLSYNSVAMQYLAQAQFDQCLAMLRKAEAITAPGNFKKCQSLQILTFNNIGCCYRKLGKLKSALKYLKEAAQIGSTCAHVKNLSITHLNLCAIQSQLGRHDLALEHAQAAIFHTQEELVSMDAKGHQDERDEDEDYSGTGETTDLLDAKSREEKIISLAVAYHNLAVELEFNGRGEASLQWYKKALQLVWKYKDTNSALCDSFKKIFMDAKKKMELQRSGNGSNRAGHPPAPHGNQRPMARPKSAHASSRAAGGNAGASRADVSYSATVASQCYKPVKLSQAGLNYASPPKGTTCNRAAARSRVTPSMTSSKVQRPSSASTYRQRPMSASAVRVSTVANATQGQGPDPNTSASNIDAHWKKLEKEYSMENSSFPHSSTNGKPSSRTLARPQSARATSHRAAHSRQSRNQHDADTLLFTTDRGGGEFSGEDEDYGVVDDDDPSDEEDEDLENDDFADLLLRRDEKQQIRQQAQDERQEDAEERADKEPLAPGRGHRHRQALNESQRKSAFGAEQSLDKDGHMPRFSALGADESDLPNQRVSHMEYLRRMKRLAENMNDDLTGRSPSITAPPSSKSKNTQSTPQRSKPPTLISTANTPKPAAEDQDSPILTTPRGTSKIRERLERMRSESFHNLPQFEENKSDATEARATNPASTTSPASEPHVEDDEVFMEITEAVNMYTTEHDIGNAEQLLVHAAAAKRIQAYARGMEGRDRARMEKRQLRERNAVENTQVQRREDNWAVAHEEAEIANVAASLIQKIYRRKLYDSYASTYQALPLDDKDEVSADDKAKSLGRHSDTTDIRDREGEAQAQSADLHCLDTAATRIQAIMKGFYTREIVSKHEATRLSRMYAERKHMEVALGHAMALEQAFLDELSATKIQALVRGRQARALYEATKIGLNAAAEKIQHSFRSHYRHIVKATDVGVRSVAARSIQQMFRSYVQRQNRGHEATINDELNEVHHIAAMSLQRFWRQMTVRRELLLEELEAATCIQALGRGHLTRKSFQALCESASQIGLSKPSSAFSISAGADAALDEKNADVDDGTVDEKRGRNASINLSFLPAALRAMYLDFVNSAAYPEARAAQKFEYDMDEVQDMDLHFDDLMLEFETCADVSTAYFAINAMRMLVIIKPESHHTLQHVIKVAQLIEQRIPEPEIWTPEMQQGCLWFLDAFQDLLLRSSR